MTKKMMANYTKVTNNGLIGYLNENEIRNLCKSVSKDENECENLANNAIARSMNINNVTVSRITK